jgi:hypothetical protein
MILIQFDFSYHGPFGEEMTDAMDGLARSIADEPGLIWKIWTENEAAKQAGGIYLFADEETARAYVSKHTARLESFGITDPNVKLFDVNDALTGITRGPLPAAPDTKSG